MTMDRRHFLRATAALPLARAFPLEPRDALVEKREKDFARFPWHYRERLVTPAFP